MKKRESNQEQTDLFPKDMDEAWETADIKGHRTLEKFIEEESREREKEKSNTEGEGPEKAA